MHAYIPIGIEDPLFSTMPLCLFCFKQSIYILPLYNWIDRIVDIICTVRVYRSREQRVHLFICISTNVCDMFEFEIYVCTRSFTVSMVFGWFLLALCLASKNARMVYNQSIQSKSVCNTCQKAAIENVCVCIKYRLKFIIIQPNTKSNNHVVWENAIKRIAHTHTHYVKIATEKRYIVKNKRKTLSSFKLLYASAIRYFFCQIIFNPSGQIISQSPIRCDTYIFIWLKVNMKGL